MPGLENTVDVNKSKAAREMRYLVVKNAPKNHKPHKPFRVGELCYKRHFDRKRTVRIESLCVIIKIRRSRESYYIMDLE